eukprot:1478024-Alexandrium_andersonii.AAC.1
MSFGVVSCRSGSFQNGFVSARCSLCLGIRANLFIPGRSRDCGGAVSFTSGCPPPMRHQQYADA